MMYALMIWTVVAMSGQPARHVVERDWRLLAEFHYLDSTASTQKKCEDAARQLGLDSNRYRCIKIK